MNNTKKKWPASIAGIISIAATSLGNAGPMGAEYIAPSGTIYLGVFGGGGGGTSTKISQLGTALYNYRNADSPILNGGPIAVNAVGQSNNSSAWLAGGQVGYRWSERPSNYFSSNWVFAPATELEGFYLGRSAMVGKDLTNESILLIEHDFRATYPMRAWGGLVNGILYARSASLGRFQPYIGIGAGTGVISISGATSIQTTPGEERINHYNSDTSDTNLVFAAQPKIGISFNVTDHTAMFLEYRFLYLSASDYIFGSTVYPIHVATTNWNVKIGSQYFNMGTIGVHFDL